MRKLLLHLFAFSVLLAGCQKVENSTEAEVKVLPTEQSPRLTYQEAAAVAQKSIGWLEQNTKTRGKRGARTINHANTKAVVGDATRSGGEADTLMYVFNFANNEGFAMVATARDSEQLIAVTEQGNYTPGVETENEGFNMFARAAEEYVSTLAITPGPNYPDPNGPFYKIETQESQAATGPLLETKWEQKGIYGSLCPNIPYGVAGCVAIAMAQILVHHQYPASIALTYPNAPTSSLTLDWEGIELHTKTGFCSCGADSIAIHNQIAHLCRELGERVNMNYYDEGFNDKGEYVNPKSNAYSSTVPSALSGLGYSSNSSLIAYDLQTICSNIDGGKPVYMDGRRYTNEAETETRGHAWLIDGYMIVTTSCITYISPVSINGPWRIDNVTNSYAYYAHCNWGWNGTYNGYFSNGVFNIANAYQYDESHSIDHDFHYKCNLQMITNITPNI